MDVVIAYGRRIVSDEVRALTKEKVGRLGHLCPGLERAEVHFSEEHNPRIADRERCEVIIIGHGRTIRARAAAPGPLVAVDLVVEKLEHQLEKTKGRLVARTHPRRRPANSVFDPAGAGAHRLRDAESESVRWRGRPRRQFGPAAGTGAAGRPADPANGQYRRRPTVE